MLAFVLLFVLLNVFDEVGKWIHSRASPLLIVCYAGAELTDGAQYLLPASLLFGTLYGLWQLARNHEIAAMRAAGISVPRIMWPVLVAGAIVSAGALALGEYVTPRATMWAAGVRRTGFTTFTPDTVTTRIGYFNEAERRKWWIGSVSIFRPGLLYDVTVDEEATPTRARRVVTAERAEYLDGAWWLWGAREVRYKLGGGPLDQGRPTPLQADPSSVREMAAWKETPLAIVAAVKRPDFLSSREMRAYLAAHPNLSNEQRNAMRVECHQRLALPWACFVVTLFAIPVGTQSGRQNALRGVFFATACFMAYYAMLQAGVLLGKWGAIPAWMGAWAANVVFAVSGVVLLFRSR
jgi:lipopolysaccharide export system permease protein